MENIKKISLSIVTALTITTTFTGCGSDGGDDLSDGSSTGIYDLRNYIAPSTDDTQTFKEYENYSGTDSSSVYQTGTNYSTFDMGSGDNFTETMSDELEAQSFSVSSSKITTTTEDEILGDMTINMVRKADLGDTIVTMDEEFTDSQYGYTMTGGISMSCKLLNHYDSKTFSVSSDSYTFTDVLESECTTNYTGEITGNGESHSSSSIDKSTIYFAKGIGMVLEYDRNCLDENNDIQDDKTYCPAGESATWEVLTNYTEPVQVEESKDEPITEDDEVVQNDSTLDVSNSTQVLIFKNTTSSAISDYQTHYSSGGTLMDLPSNTSCETLGFSLLNSEYAYASDFGYGESQTIYYNNQTYVTCVEYDFKSTSISGNVNKIEY